MSAWRAVAGWEILICLAIKQFIFVGHDRIALRADGDLIEIGAEVLNLQQPTVLGIEEIGREFAGKVCFQSLCDIQKTLPSKGEDIIIGEAQSLIRHWATDTGGFILGDYGDGEAIAVPLEKKRIMFDAFIEADRWKKGAL